MQSKDSDKNDSQNSRSTLLAALIFIILAILASVFVWDENDRDEDAEYFENILGKTNDMQNVFCAAAHIELDGRNNEV